MPDPEDGQCIQMIPDFVNNTVGGDNNFAQVIVTELGDDPANPWKMDHSVYF